MQHSNFKFHSMFDLPDLIAHVERRASGDLKLTEDVRCKAGRDWLAEHSLDVSNCFTGSALFFFSAHIAKQIPRWQ